MPQDDGTSIPFDISVTACIPTVYHHIVLFLQQHGIELVDTRFSYSVKYRGGVYAHDFDSEIRRQLQNGNREVSEGPETTEAVWAAESLQVNDFSMP